MLIPHRWLVCTLAAFAILQTGAAQEGQKVSAIVQVQRDSVGANLVRISVLDPQYPAEALRAQIDRIGSNVGGGVRGVQVTDDAIDPKKPAESRLLRATFAVDGLIDRAGGWVKVAPIVKALAGAPAPHSLANIQVDFDFEKATDKDLGDFSSPAVEVSRRMVDRSLEYTVRYKTQDSSKIDVPDFATQDAGGQQASTSPSFKPDWVAIVVVGIAVISVGALVYCLFLLNPFYRKKYRP